MSFESPRSLEHSEYDKLVSLWREFGFIGKPPKDGSPVLERLKEACESYVKFVESESVHRVPGSEAKRRNLHNEIALMVIGKERSRVDLKTAEKITEFVCRFTRGVGCSQILSELSEIKKERALE